MQCSIPALRLAIVALNVFCHCFYHLTPRLEPPAYLRCSPIRYPHLGRGLFNPFFMETKLMTNGTEAYSQPSSSAP